MKTKLIILFLAVLNSFISFAQSSKSDNARINLSHLEYITSHNLVESKNFIAQKGFKFDEKDGDEDWYVDSK